MTNIESLIAVVSVIFATPFFIVYHYIRKVLSEIKEIKIESDIIFKKQMRIPENMINKHDELIEKVSLLTFIVDNPAQYKVGDMLKGGKVIKSTAKHNYVGDLTSKSNLEYYWIYECYDKKENKVVFHTEDE